MKKEQIEQKEKVGIAEVMQSHSKIILDNRTNLPMDVFLPLANRVIKMGRISNDNKQYCYLTSFNIDGEEYHIVSDLNKNSDKLTFYKVADFSGFA